MDFVPLILFIHAYVSLQEYDYVFDIELDEGSPTMRKLKLPYNKDSTCVSR